MRSNHEDLERRLVSARDDARTERRRTDLTEQRLRAEASELETSNAELESFGSMVSHDLHAPVRAIEGFGRALQLGYAHLLDDEGRRLLTIVLSETTRLKNLIDDLLTFSRLGSEALAEADVDMTALARDVAQEQAGLLKSPVRIDPLPKIRGDRVLLRQVWTNLIANAVKFSSTTDNAQLSVFAVQEPERVVYSIRDNGVGFDVHTADGLFSIFRRLHRNDEFPGTGAGLAIVKRIVERHGGTVWAKAKIGAGATFSFALPAHE